MELVLELFTTVIDQFWAKQTFAGIGTPLSPYEFESSPVEWRARQDSNL